MARITTKYRTGEGVFYGPISGRVTAIFIRGRHRAYEFSYIDRSGDPKSVQAEECELELRSEDPKIGFVHRG